MKYEIITGSAKQVEDKLNSKHTYNAIEVVQMTATDNTTTILIKVG